MKTPRIVLIEDNPGDVLLVKLALDEHQIPHTLVEFESGAEAVRALCVPGAVPPDAILLDLNTPRTDGFDTLVKLRRCFADIPITILTSSGARSDRERASLEGALYLEKASQLSQFLGSVAAVVKEMLKDRQRSLGSVS